MACWNENVLYVYRSTVLVRCTVLALAVVAFSMSVRSVAISAVSDDWSASSAAISRVACSDAQ